MLKKSLLLMSLPLLSGWALVSHAAHASNPVNLAEAMTSALHATRATTLPALSPQDLTIVYGGADITRDGLFPS